MMAVFAPLDEGHFLVFVSGSGMHHLDSQELLVEEIVGFFPTKLPSFPLVESKPRLQLRGRPTACKGKELSRLAQQE